MSEPNPNLILNSAQLDKWSKESGIVVEWDGAEQMFKVSSQTRTSSRWGAYQDVAVEPSTQYTYSLDGMAGNVSCHLAIADGTSWSAARATFTQTRDRLSYTWTTGASTTVARVYLCITPTQAGQDAGGSYGYFAMPKLELGSEATEWCAHPSEGGWRMGRYIDSGGLSHLMSKIKAAIAATVTGVKGNAESSYRTGQVNITPANLGAVSLSAELLTTNPFAPASFEGPYISKIDNAFYAADKRWAVTATNLSGGVNPLFDGNYETRSTIEKSQTSVILMDFSNTTYFPGYPYGYILVSFYYTEQPESVSGRVYCNYEPHGIGWHDITFERVADSTTGACIYRSSHQWYYNISKLEITVAAKASNNARITQIEMNLDRPSSQRTPFLSKYAAETLYYNLTAPKFIGALQGNADTATTAGNVTGTVAIANGGTGATSATNARTNLGVPPTSHASSATTYGTGTDANYGHVKLSGATNSTSGTSGGIAATPSAVKTAYDLANTANGTANTALSGVNGTLIYDHTYTIQDGVATFTAHVYCKGQEVTSNYQDSAFSWSYRLSDAISETGTPSVVSLGTGKTKTINITTLGLGGHVIGTFTTD